MQERFGPNVGAEISSQLQVKDHRVDAGPATNLRLVAVKTEKMAADKITVQATLRQQGVIIVGPSHEMLGSSSRTDLLGACKAYRWVLNPVKMDRQRPWLVRGRPSIIPAKRVKVSCPTCGYEYLLWDDEMRRLGGQYRAQKRGEAVDRLTSDGAPEKAAKAEAYKYAKGIRGGVVLCSRCSMRGRETIMSKQFMRNTMFPASWPPWQPADPVYNTVDDPELKLIAEAWNRPVRETPEILPRIWGIYPIGKAPSDWIPRDGKAAEIERRVNAAFKATIRPFHIAYKNSCSADRPSELVDLLLEASPLLQVGWVEETLLAGDPNVGFTRRFYDLPREQTV